MRVLQKSLKYLLITVLLLVAILLAIGYYFLNTNSGLKSAIDLANRYSGYAVSAESIDGDLLGRTELKKLHIKGKGMDFSSESVLLDWQSKSLLDRSLVVKSIAIDGASVMLMPPEEKLAENDQSFSLQDIDLPIDIKLEDLLITNLVIKNPVKNPVNADNTAVKTAETQSEATGDIVIDKIQLSIDYIGQKGIIHQLAFEGFDTQINLTGEVETKGNYPLHLETVSQYNYNHHIEVVKVGIDGALKDTLALRTEGEGFANFTLNGTLAALFETPEIVADLSLRKLDGTPFAMTDTEMRADLNIAGKLAQTPTLKAVGEVFYDARDTDKLKLTLDSHFDGERAELSAFTLDLLTAKQQLTGNGYFNLSDQRLDIKLASDALHWPQNTQTPNVTLKNTLATITGTLDDYQFTLETQGNTQAIGAVDLVVNGRGNTTAIKAFDANCLLNQQPLTLSGNAQWSPALAYHANIRADKISPFNQLPGVEKLNITVDGNDTQYTAKGGVYVFREDIPPADMTLSVSGTPSDLDNAEVHINTLGGEINLSAKGKIAPLDLTADVRSENIQPQTFYPDVVGNINHTLHLTAAQNGGHISAEAIIEKLDGEFQQYPLAGSGTVRFDQANQQLTFQQLALDVAGNQVDANGVLALAPQGESDLVANVDAKNLDRLLPDLSGDITANVVAKGTLAKPELTAKINGDRLVYQSQRIDKLRVDTAIHVDTATAKLTGEGEVLVNSPDTDALQLRVNGDFDGNRVNVSRFAVDLLTAKQQLNGKGSYVITDRRLDATLSSDALHWPQNTQTPSLQLKNTLANITGTLDDYHATISTDTTTPDLGDVPVTLRADGSLSALEQFTAQVKLNDQPVDLSGKAAWNPALAYQVRVQSANVKPLRAIPGIKQLDVTVNGDDSAYRATGKLSVYADTIPPSDVVLDVDGTPDELNVADLTIKTLGGSFDVSAKGKLSPLAIVADVTSKNIQPQTFYPDVNANISNELTLSATKQGEHLLAEAVIKTLSGTLQNYPIAGSGNVLFDQGKNKLDINGLSLNLAGNQAKADGVLALSGDNSNLTATIDAPKLKRLLPELGGAVKANVTLKGSLEKPAVAAKITGNQVTYQDSQIKQLNATANVNLRKDSIQLRAQLDGMRSGETQLDQALATIDGTFAKHQLKINVVAPKTASIPSVTLAGNGGFAMDNMAWQGKLNTLNINNETLGKWQLAQSAPLSLSRDTITAKQLCLQQKPSTLCVDGKLAGDKGGFDVTLKSLSSKQFKSFMPPTVDVDTTISGKTRIDLVGGKPNVKGKLSANGGRLKLNAGNGVLTSNIKQFDAGFVLKNNRVEALVKSDLTKIGKIDVTAELPSINQGNLKANIKISSQSLKFIEEIAPQLTDVKGRMTGDMTLSGNPSKALNVAGKVTLHKTDFNVPQFGSEIRDLTLDIFAKNGSKIGFKGKAKAGKGDFNINGEINPATQRGNINLKGSNFQAANSNKLKVTISPDVNIVFADTIQVRGEVLIPKALIVPASTGSKVTASEDVILPYQKKKKIKKNNSLIDVEIAVKLGDDVRVASADIETRLTGGIKVNAKPGKAPKAAGAIEVETGELRIYGQMLNIERGRVIFSNGPIANPSLDIRTSREIEAEEVIVGANVLGTVSKPEISLFSTPSMADSSILSYLIFGHPPDSDSFGTAALLQTGGVVGANSAARDVRLSLGLDVLDISLAGVEAGKNITPKGYVGVKSNFFESLNQFIANYKLNGKAKIESAISSDEISLDWIKVIETD